MVPWTLGGTNDPENLIGACWTCNQTKGDLTIEQMGWELSPTPTDWDGLTRYYKLIYRSGAGPAVCGLMS